MFDFVVLVDAGPGHPDGHGGHAKSNPASNAIFVFSPRDREDVDEVDDERQRAADDQEIDLAHGFSLGRFGESRSPPLGFTRLLGSLLHSRLQPFSSTRHEVLVAARQGLILDDRAAANLTGEHADDAFTVQANQGVERLQTLGGVPFTSRDGLRGVTLGFESDLRADTGPDIVGDVEAVREIEAHPDVLDELSVLCLQNGNHAQRIRVGEVRHFGNSSSIAHGS